MVEEIRMSVQACQDISPEAERAVMHALADTRFDFRSVEGLSKETNFPHEVVEAVLRKNSDRIRISAVPDTAGHTLYTLSSRPRKLQERLSEALTFITGVTR